MGDKLQKRIVDTRDAAAALLDDLSYFREIQTKSNISFGDIRAFSVILRRLICQNDLISIASPRIGTLRIITNDTNEYEQIAKNHKVQLFCSLGVDVFDFHMDEICAYDIVGHKASRKIEKNKINKSVYSVNKKQIELTVDRFQRQKIIFYNEIWITRHALISYVANKLSAAHSDNNLNEIEKRLAQVRCGNRIVADDNNGIKLEFFDNGLDSSEIKMDYSKKGIDILSLEVIAAAQRLANSPDVLLLESKIRDELGF